MTRRTTPRRGATAVIAMMFLLLLSTLTLAMFSSTATNMVSARNLSELSAARASAESGMRWMAYRFLKMDRPRTSVGRIDAAAAASLWPSIRTAIINDLGQMLDAAERPVSLNGNTLKTSSIAVEEGGGSFTITITPHPLSADDPLDARCLRVVSTGRYGSAQRSVRMDFKIDKKVRFAIVGKVPIQLGRNVLVEGTVAMATTAQPSGQPPIFSLSDFRNLTPRLTNRLDDWQNLLKNRYSGYDNRISVNAGAAYNAAVAAGFSDVNQDGAIDEYDLFLGEFDKSGAQNRVNEAEFTNVATGKLYDDNLMTAIDSLGGPLYSGDSVRDGYQDRLIDDRDAYAKIRGQLLVAESASSLISRLQSSGKRIADVIQGPIIPANPGDAPVRFGAGGGDFIDLNPANFEQCAQGFKNRLGTVPNLTTPPAANTVISGKTITAAAANGGIVIEESPRGSRNFQAVYKRPVFKNVTFRNCAIPKGLNALFDNCKFEGTTFIDSERNVTTSSGAVTYSKDEGMNWARRNNSGSGTTDSSGEFKDTNGDGKWDQYKLVGMSSFANLTDSNGDGVKELPSGAGSYAYGAASGDRKTKGSAGGNNVRFNNCTFEGPLAGAYSTAYTHFANSWEFTGATRFNNLADQTATIVAPQTNIEMGSFTDPTQAPSTLVGVVVAGNLDIRGTGLVDGCIIITGDGAGNTTLGYFGASDSDNNPSAMPEGGYGRLNLRYNPYRALPDGINIPIEILPDISTYAEPRS